MGREQKRKEQRKYKNKKIDNEVLQEEMMKTSTVLKIILGVVVVILIFYYGLAIFVTKEVDLSGSKDNSSTSDNDSSNSVSNAILAKNTFNQTDEVYYVYYYDFTDEEEVISNSISSLTDHTIYRVDTSSGLNSNYVDDNGGNKNVDSIDNLKVKNPTIIKIDNDKVVSYYEGVDAISNFLNK